MLIPVIQNQPFVFATQLKDGNVGVYPRACVYDNVTGTTLVQAIDLSYVSGTSAMYTGVGQSVSGLGGFPVEVIVFSDAGRTIRDTFYDSDGSFLMVLQAPSAPVAAVAPGAMLSGEMTKASETSSELSYPSRLCGQLESEEMSGGLSQPDQLCGQLEYEEELEGE